MPYCVLPLVAQRPQLIRGIETEDSLPESVVCESEAYEEKLREYSSALRDHQLQNADSAIKRFSRLLEFTIQNKRTHRAMWPDPASISSRSPFTCHTPQFAQQVALHVCHTPQFARSLCE